MSFNRLLLCLSPLLLLGLSSVVVLGAPAPKPSDSTRLRSDQSLHHHLIRRAVESNKITKVTAGLFQIDFHCESPKPGFCDKAADAAKRACNRIQSAIKLRQPVTMLFTMFKPCNQDSPTAESCPVAAAVGLAAPLFSLPVRHRDDSKTYMYPTVLLKQTDLVPQDLAVAWPKYDVLAAFNALAKYTFEDPSGLPLETTDMEYVATHEILHGLGLGVVTSASALPAGNTTMLAPGHDPYPIGAPAGEITLPIDLVNLTAAGDLRMYRLLRPSIYERFVTFTGPNGVRTELSEFAQQMQQAVDRVIQATGVKPLSGQAQQNASQTLDLTDAMRAAVAKAGPAYLPADVYRALGSDSAAGALMVTMMKAATTRDAFDFDPTRWAAIVGQLDALRVGRDGYKVESGLNPFLRGSSLAHVQLPAGDLVDGGNATEPGAQPTASVDAPGSSTEAARPLPQSFSYLSTPFASKANSTVPGNTTSPFPPVPKTLGPNFMLHFMTLPWPLEQLIRETKAPASGIGPGLVSAMVAMGYTPASASEFVSRKDVAELVRAEVPLVAKAA